MSHAGRLYEFEPTPAVAASRAHSRYINCSLCDQDHSEYLFHRVGLRFVRCRSCGLVYVNPVGEVGPNYFDIDALGAFESDADRRLYLRDFSQFLERVSAQFERIEARSPRRSVLYGRFMTGMVDLESARRLDLSLVELGGPAFARLALESEIDASPITDETDLIILHELLEACSDPAEVVARLVARAPSDAWFVVTYANVDSLPARLLRRHWPPFFELKTAFFSTANLISLMGAHDLVLWRQFAYPTTRTPGYVATRLVGRARPAARLGALLPERVEVPVRAGHQTAMFRRRLARGAEPEKLSIVLPVYNEADYAEKLIEAVIGKSLKIDKELIIVESNSSDGTREIVRRYEGRSGIKVIYEQRPRGKGHAVRAGLAAVSGSIVLIQDADFEYDIDDYDALLEPILQRRAQFVLGSRTLGKNDWKVRRFATDAKKALLLNMAQVVFAKTFNALYQQRVTDVNTMFKVFRSECLDGLDLESDGFDLDIELACKLVKHGHAPLEVPVNYIARDFEQGKKISFVRDALPSYAALFRYRFG